ncbi:MAG: 23S rRNA (uracil(1939)-C(5))-methyltransferase RlmD [Saprospiraceae bacterium]|nr:23S rRNA (uracil(1939)-C(5))-methyltransferase RlmD [Saprospiraceae bacterium]
MARKQPIWEEVTVTGIADKGMSVGRDKTGRVVFLQGGLPGDVVDVRILRKRKGIWQGVPEKMHRASPDRISAPCQHFLDCGGCKWQDLDYHAQLNQKEQVVRNAMSRIAKVDIGQFEEILGSEKIFQYRNKMEYSFSNQRWKTKEEIALNEEIQSDGALGLHPPRFFNKVVDIHECLLQEHLSNDIRNFVRTYALKYNLSYFDPMQHKGFLRNMIIRNTKDGQWMVVMSFHHEAKSEREALLNELVKKFPQITSLHYVINRKKNDTLFDQDIQCYHGQDHIVEEIGDLHYKIRPKSFFQTNPHQAEQLYDLTKDYCSLEGTETVYDLYTGTGSIALYVAKTCREVVGVEEVGDAIKDAQENAERNQISNAHFYVGDVKSVFSPALLQKHGSPDVLIADPPRGGMHGKVIENILEGEPHRIVYISCNPSTQARDIQLLSEKYQVAKMRPVDMFPHTSHIENVAQLIHR